MRSILIGAVVCGILIAVLAAILGADFGSALDPGPPDAKARSAVEGAALWGAAGLVVGFGVGAVGGAIVRALRNARRCP